MAFQKLESVSAALWDQKAVFGSWARLAASYGVSVGTIVRVAMGYEPKRAKIRQALGLLPRGAVEVAAGVELAPRSELMVSSRICICGRAFIPNHPRRRYCQTCRPHK